MITYQTIPPGPPPVIKILLALSAIFLLNKKIKR